jgi:hypothetical protein
MMVDADALRTGAVLGEPQGWGWESLGSRSLGTVWPISD